MAVFPELKSVWVRFLQQFKASVLHVVTNAILNLQPSNSMYKVVQIRPGLICV